MLLIRSQISILKFSFELKSPILQTKWERLSRKLSHTKNSNLNSQIVKENIHSSIQRDKIEYKDISHQELKSQLSNSYG